MGERTPPKTHGFWISFRRLPPRSDSSEMLNRRISLRAAAFTLKCAAAQFYILDVQRQRGQKQINSTFRVVYTLPRPRGTQNGKPPCAGRERIFKPQV